MWYTAGSLIMQLREALSAHVQYVQQEPLQFSPVFCKNEKYQINTLPIYESKNILKLI